MLTNFTLASWYGTNYTTTNSNYHLSSGATAAIFVVVAALVILYVVSLWKVFKKAGRPGWAAVVPFYNNWVLFEISGYPGWIILVALFAGLLGSFIPLIGILIDLGYIIILIMAMLKLAKRFSKSPIFAIFGLVIFNFIGLPILAYGDAKYNASLAP